MVNFESLLDSLLRKRFLFQFMSSTTNQYKIEFDQILSSKEPIDLICNIFNSIKIEEKVEDLNWEEYKVEYLTYIQSRMSSLMSLDKTIVIRRFKDDVKLSDKFKDIENSVRIMLERRKNFVENKNSTVETFKDCLESFKRREYTEKDVNIVPLQISNEMLRFMQLRGLDYVIVVTEKKYTLWFYLKTISVVVIGIASIAAGILLTFATSGLLINTGQMLISEGIGDIMYALQTLQKGTFSWSDYGTQKAFSILVTVSISAITLGLSRLRILNNAPYQTFGDEIAGKGFSQLGAYEMAKKVDKEVVTKYAWQSFGEKMGANVWKAVSMGGVSMSVDYVMKNYLDSMVLEVATYITQSLQSKYKI
jgi:hypothetical protein